MRYLHSTWVDLHQPILIIRSAQALLPLIIVLLRFMPYLENDAHSSENGSCLLLPGYLMICLYQV